MILERGTAVIWLGGFGVVLGASPGFALLLMQNGKTLRIPRVLAESAARIARRYEVAA